MSGAAWRLGPLALVAGLACGEPTTLPDAGAPPADVGVVTTDDAGETAPDAGVIPSADAGQPVDAGSPPPPPFDPTDDWAFLTDGVRTIESGGALPSNLVVHGPTAFPVVYDEQDRTFVAAARADLGKVVVFGHEAYVGGLLEEPGDGARLVANALAWLGEDAGATVAAINGLGGLLTFAEGAGYRATRVTTADLEGVDVLAVPASTAREGADWAAIEAWVRAGGGLLVAGQAWYWSQSNANTATAYPANAILNRLGVTYSARSDVSAGQDSVGPEPPGPLRQAREALARLQAHADGDLALSADEIQLAVRTVTLAVDVLPVGPFADYFDVARAYEAGIGPVVIETDRPLVRADQPLEALAVVIAGKLAVASPPAETAPHPMGDAFPGAVPAEAPRTPAALIVEATHAGLARDYAFANARSAALRSTGRYAAPGDVVVVTAPMAAVEAGLGIQIGAHSDRLWNKDEWSRYPDMVRREALTGPRTEIASGFGGPVYITVPVGAELGPIEVTVEGAVPMAHFRLGETSLADWPTLRQSPAPWAELGSDKFVLTVPASAVRGLDDPQALLQFWDRVLDADAALSNFSPDRPRAERIVFDRQISAGWMHSGYPIMAHLASVEEGIDLARLSTEGSWGIFHELGHNHQWRPWVLPGTTEANVNLFSVYAMEEIVGRSRDVAHSALDPTRRADRLAAYLATGPDFAQWSVWTALEMYLQLEEAFGWAPYSTAFTAYRNLSGAEVPRNDPARIDAWMVQMSQAVGRDLSAFFVAWGHPVSPEAVDEVSMLPAWTDHPLAGP